MRQNANYKRGSRDERGLDDLDRDILAIIASNPGTNIINIYRRLHSPGRIDIEELTLRYRPRTLELAGFIKTEKVGNERRCHIV